LFEEEADRHFKVAVRGFFHVYIGQEAIAAGLRSSMRLSDPLISGYRQHGLAIAKGVTTKAAMSELFGKITGSIKGKGGSMHFFSKEHAYYGGDGIVGGQIGTGAGLGFAEKYKESGNVAVAMFGDGAARQGMLLESFNMAMTWKLPVIFICENNFYAMGTSVERTSNVHDIYKLGSAFDMPSFQVDGMRPEAVHEAMTAALERARKGEGPTFLEIRTYRYRGHSRSDAALYRTREEVEAWKKKDPIETVRETILENELASLEEIEAIDERITAEIEAAVEFAQDSEFPTPDELYTDNYSEPYPFLNE
jgi:pyruvate dehydrogenase E1 component alpha subunit